MRTVLNKASAVVGEGEFTRPEVETLLPYASILHLNRYQKLWRPLAEPMSTFYVVVSGNIRLTGLGVTAHVGPEEGLAGAAWMRENLHINEATATEPTVLVAIRAEQAKSVRGPVMDGMCARLRATVGFTYTMLLLSSYIPVLSGQRVAVIRRLAFMMKPRVFNKGDLLIREGDAAKEVFFLVLGEVAVYIWDKKTKREKEVNRIDHKAAYTSFGELALVKTQKHKATLHRSASVYAADRSLLLEIGANDYLTMLQLIPSLKTHVEFLRNLHGDTMMRDEETPPSPEK